MAYKRVMEIPVAKLALCIAAEGVGMAVVLLMTGIALMSAEKQQTDSITAAVIESAFIVDGLK